MPEGDTVFLAATRLRAGLAGEMVSKSDIRVPRWSTADLSGRRIEDVVARGKHLFFRFEGGLTLHTHYKMDGSWHLYRPGERWRGPTFQARAVLETPRRVAVGFRLGTTELLPTVDEDRIVRHLGPDPLGDDWDPDEVVRRMRARGTDAIGEVLLDQSVVAGPGNVYKCEICFLRGVDPWTPVDLVPDLPAMVHLVKRLMDANRTTGNQITTGDTRPGRERWVYGRAGSPCRRCGTRISRRDQRGYGGERITFWCPRCQPGTLPPPAPLFARRGVYSGSVAKAEGGES